MSIVKSCDCEGGENPVGQDEALDDGASLPQLGIPRPMADSSALASEVGGNRNKHPPIFTLVNGVPTSFLRKHNLCVSFNKGRCQHPGSHKHAYIVDKFLARAGQVPQQAGFSAEVDSWRQSTAPSRPPRYLKEHLQSEVSGAFNPNTSTVSYTHLTLPTKRIV